MARTADAGSIMVTLIEVEPNRWRVKREQIPVARSSLPMPNVISDIMPPTEQVDGKFYESKAAFRAVGRALGLTEVGNEKIEPRKYRDLEAPQIRRARREALGRAVVRYRAGQRPRRQHAIGE
jgi:hypothetical protein